MARKTRRNHSAAFRENAALMSTSADLSGACPDGASVVDLVGYGAAASCHWGDGAAPTLDNRPSKALSRLDAGCRSLKDNAADFERADASPRNSASSTVQCDRWHAEENLALYYDGWDLVAEADGSTGAVLATYVHGAATDELLSRRESSGGQAVFYVHDHLGSVRALSNASGNIVESYQYEAFGKPTVFDASGNVMARSAYGNRFMFTGREYLAHAGLYDFRNRTYSPRWGRFIEVDPIRFQGGDLNMYRYVGNGADIWTDPDGLVSPIAAIIAVAGLIVVAEEYVHGMIHANDVSARAKEKWPDDPQENAMRHCIWQCELTQSRGAIYAMVAAEMHELAADADLDQQADYFNNQCGRSLGADDQTNCEEECEKLWNSDGLAKNK